MRPFANFRALLLVATLLIFLTINAQSTISAESGKSAPPTPTIKFVLDARYGDNKQLTIWIFRPDSTELGTCALSHPEVKFNGIRIAFELYTQGRGYIGGDELPKTFDMMLYQGADTARFTFDVPPDNAKGPHSGLAADTNYVSIAPTSSTVPKNALPNFLCKSLVTVMGHPYSPN